jgi:hypothetical protein
MNDIQVTPAAPAVFLNPAYVVAKSGASSGDTSLLPDPQPLTDNDAIAGFLALESRGRNLSLNRAVRSIDALRQERRVEWEKQKAALCEAAKAHEDSGFWGNVGEICGTIGKVAAVVTSMAVAVGTGGASAPFVLAVAGACLSTAALAQGEFQILQELGVDAEASEYIELGLAVGAVVCTGAAAFMAAPESATQFEKVANAMKKVSTAAAGATTITAGIAIGNKYAADAQAGDCHADAATAHLNETRLDRMLTRILDELEESEKSYRQTVRAAQAAIEIEDNTILLSIGRS